jgi:hypothetical protein
VKNYFYKYFEQYKYTLYLPEAEAEIFRLHIAPGAASLWVNGAFFKITWLFSSNI